MSDVENVIRRALAEDIGSGDITTSLCVLEGLMANDLTQVIPEGFLITPPDTRGNTQRVFVPRTALLELNVLAVIGRPEAHKKTAEDIRQEKLFIES